MSGDTTPPSGSAPEPSDPAPEAGDPRPRDVRGGAEPGGIEAELGRALAPEFEVVRSLGRGRMAEVFLAREVELRRLVAVKVLRPELALQEAPRKRFLREARSAARISHPNVVAVHRVGSLPDATPYLIMEYVDGRTMDDVLQADGPRSEQEVRTLLGQMAAALQAAHDEGVVHRDVRPNNIMRSRSGERYVLTDFGVAGIRESGGEAVTRLTGVGEILGDVRYTAPEQLEGERPRPETDVYALAITAYELLTREDPYGAERVADVIEAHLRREPRPVSRIRPGVGRDLEDLLLRCLAKRPEHRPPGRDVAKRLAGEGVALEGGGPLHDFLAELKRRQVYKVGAAYAALAFLVLQGAEVTLPVLAVPDWFYEGLVLVVLAGFPISLVLAWVYDLTAGGIERTAASDGATDPGRLRALQVAGVVVSLVVAVALGWILLT